MIKKKISRRDFLKLASLTTAGATLAACAPTAATPEPTTAPTDMPAEEPVKGGKAIIAVGGWAVDPTRQVLDELGFTEKTGIEVDIQTRPGTANEFITQMTSAVNAGTSPYDVIDFEDEIAITFSRAGFMRELDSLLPSDFWDDFTQVMINMSDVWDRYNGDTIRIHHNYEACYCYHRKDWFDEKGIEVPKTWDDEKALGGVFTDEGTGVWAIEDGLVKGGMLNVYLAWVTLQAGGNPFDVDDKFATALEFIHELMYTDKSLNPASLQKDYDQQNADYTSDRVAYMRQWPFFYDVSRAAEDWFEEDKAAIVLPPVGPGGKENSTYAAGWGFGIPKTAENMAEAEELLKFLVAEENAGEMAKLNTWFLSARKSVLDATAGEGMSPYLKLYAEEGVIGTRPFHDKFVEALAVLEDAASAYLTNQISLEETMTQAQNGMANLG
jgi:ABC-type glycerol-3-phosphate transport system substrate-binding protein